MSLGKRVSGLSFFLHNGRSGIGDTVQFADHGGALIVDYDNMTEWGVLGLRCPFP